MEIKILNQVLLNMLLIFSIVIINDPKIKWSMNKETIIISSSKWTQNSFEHWTEHRNADDKTAIKSSN